MGLRIYQKREGEGRHHFYCSTPLFLPPWLLREQEDAAVELCLEDGDDVTATTISAVSILQNQESRILIPLASLR